MHTHERTMLARLGFADPDRREHLHDVACQYLAMPCTLRRLVRCLGIEHESAPYAENSSSDERTSQRIRKVTSHQVQREFEIAKGFGQYQTTVGFADLMIHLQVQEEHHAVRKRTRNVVNGSGNLMWSAWQPVADHTEWSRESLGIEVKVTPVAVSDVIRQVKLYRSYSKYPRWIVATTFQIACADLACLNNEGLQHVYLGEHFQAFVATQPASQLAVSMEV